MLFKPNIKEPKRITYLWGLIVETKRLNVFAVIVFIGVAVCFYRGTDYLFNDYETLGITWISLGVAFLGVLAGVFALLVSKESKNISENSLKISNKSMKIAENSDEKMQLLANYHLLEIKGIIEDRRLNLQKHIKKIRFMAETDRDYAVAYDEYHSDYSYSPWKTYTNLQQIQTILKYSTPEYQLQVIEYIHLYFDVVKEGRDKTKITLLPEHKEQISNSYDIISKFPAFNQYEKRKKLLEVMQDITS